MAWPIGSAPNGRRVAGRGQRYRTASTPRNDAEFSANAAAGPAVATSSLPIAVARTARATLALAPLSSAARGSSSRGPVRAGPPGKHGEASACPTPGPPVRASSRFGVTPPAAVNTASAAEANSISVWLSSSSRRSRMSPSAPAEMTRRKTGSVAAVCTRAICRAPPPRSPMSHCAPTVWAQVPVLATNWAIHRRGTRCAAAAPRRTERPAARAGRRGGLGGRRRRRPFRALHLPGP